MINLYTTIKELSVVLSEAMPHRTLHFAMEGSQLDDRAVAITTHWEDSTFTHEDVVEGSDHIDQVPHSYVTVTPVIVQLVGGEVDVLEQDKLTVNETINKYRIDNTTRVRIESMSTSLRDIDKTAQRRVVINIDLISQLRT